MPRTGKPNFQPLVQVGDFLEVSRQGIKIVVNLRENLPVGTERYSRAVLRSPPPPRHLGAGDTLGILLMVNIPVPMHFRFQVRRQAIHHRTADPVQPSGHLVRPAAELPPGVQRSHHRLQPRLARGRVDVHWNPPPVIRNGNQPIPIQRQVDPGAETGHRLIHGVIQNLIDEVMQPPLVGAADIHTRPHPHRLQTLQHLDVFGRVFPIALGQRSGTARPISGGGNSGTFLGGGFRRVRDEKRLLNSQFLTPAKFGRRVSG